jgi:hypothetical protein
MATTGKKLSAAAIGAPLGVVAVWGFSAATSVAVPAEVAVSLGAVLTFVASVIIPDTIEE